MRTRTLLLLAVACGVAILAAGVALFVRLGDQDETAIGTVGAAVTVGDLRITVEGYDETGATGTAVLTVGGVDDPDGAAGFRLVTPGLALAPSGDAPAGGPPACAATTADDRRCALVFDLAGVEGTARVLVYRRGDEQVRWPLDR